MHHILFHRRKAPNYPVRRVVGAVVVVLAAVGLAAHGCSSPTASHPSTSEYR